MRIKNQVLLAELLLRGEVDCADKFTTTVNEAWTCITKFLLDDIVGYISLLADMGGHPVSEDSLWRDFLFSALSFYQFGGQAM